MKLIPLTGIGLVMVSIPILCQAPTAGRLQFEVASIKRNTSGQTGGGGGPRGDRFVVRNAPLTLLVNIAFRPPKGQLFNQQIIGGPDWVRTDRFDVEAKMEGSFPAVPYERIQLMLQTLLEDRFQLKAHREMREVPVFNLVVAKGGLKMRPSRDQSPPDSRQADISFDSLAERSKPLQRGAMRLATGAGVSALIGNSVAPAALVNLMQGQADRPVFDKTDLKTLFDFDLEFSNELATTRALNNEVEPPVDHSAASLFTAVRELGLTLESAKALLEVVVIDSAQRPTEN